MKEIEEFEMYEAKLREAYLNAGADFIIYNLDELNMILENIDLFNICKN